MLKFMATYPEQSLNGNGLANCYIIAASVEEQTHEKLSQGNLVQYADPPRLHQHDAAGPGGRA
jgi:hypothetical protein